ncbi:MAG: hypothetical protein ACPG49_07110 [Chitinophagales bacterium]
MKTLDLLRSLSKKERADFEFVMKKHKRNSLKKLHDFLKTHLKKETFPAKTIIFEAVFEENYTSKKDYKLRHELRLLNEELTHFLVTQEFENQLKSNTHFYHVWEMKMLEKRQLHKHVETAYKQNFEKAKSEFQPQFAHEILNTYLNSQITHKEVRLEFYQEIALLLEEKQGLLQEDLLQKMAANHVKQSFAVRVIRIMQADFPAPLMPDSLSLTEKQNPFTQLLQLEAKSYLQSGEEKIKTLTQLLQHLEHCNFPWLQYNRRKMVTLSNIALAYYLLGNNQEANHFYELAIEHTQTKKQKLPIEVLFNHFSNLVKMESYQKALNLYTQNEADIQGYPKVQNRFLCLKSMCHTLLQQREEAQKCIPVNIRTLPPDQYYYFRFIQLMVFYQMDDWEGALRETENFLKVLNYVKEPHFDVDYKQLAYFYLQFFKAILDIPEAQKQILLQLQSALMDCKNNESARNNHLILKWLEREVERFLND